MQKQSGDLTMYQFLLDISGTVMPMCLKNSKLLNEENDYTERERMLAYNDACLRFIGNVYLGNGKESEWLAFLYGSIVKQYDDGLADVRYMATLEAHGK